MLSLFKSVLLILKFVENRSKKEIPPTFMFRFCDQFTHHCLYNSNVTIEEASNGPSK